MQRADDFLGQAWVRVSDHEDVANANELTTAAIELLLADARAEGRLRCDASALDVRLLFTATRAAEQVEPQAWKRMLTLLIDALDTSRRDDFQGGSSRLARSLPVCTALAVDHSAS
jgi:hypothetical protein